MQKWVSVIRYIDTFIQRERTTFLFCCLLLQIFETFSQIFFWKMALSQPAFVGAIICFGIYLAAVCKKDFASDEKPKMKTLC